MFQQTLVAALGEQIRELDGVSQRLINTHPEDAESIYKKQIAIQQAGAELTKKPDACKVKLYYTIHPLPTHLMILVKSLD